MDFIELDEQDFSNLSSFSKGFPISPDVPAYSFRSSSSSDSVNSVNSIYPSNSVQTTALFIRSASIQTEPIKNDSSTPTITHSEFSITLHSPQIPARLHFNLNGPHQEGRDSQVFQGTLISAAFTLPVAVKVYRDGRENLQNALKEIEIGTKYTSGRPDFLKFFFSGQLTLDDGPIFVSIWEWIEFGSLDCVVFRVNINQVILSVAQSLYFLHNNNIAHHDLKPQNILISNLQRVVLIDFGDSKQLKSPTDTLPIEEGIGLGTLAYTASELLSKKSSNYSPFAADVYSFGVLLFYLLNGGKILPFATLIPHRAVQLILTAQKGFFAGEYNPEAPTQSPLFPLMKKCLQVDPQKRPTFTEILEFLK